MLDPLRLVIPGMIAARQMASAYVSVRMRAGRRAAQDPKLSTRAFILAESLRGVAVIEHPSAMTHASTAGSHWRCPTIWCGFRSVSKTYRPARRSRTGPGLLREQTRKHPKTVWGLASARGVPRRWYGSARQLVVGHGAAVGYRVVAVRRILASISPTER